jgi:hypothetical protein
MFLHKISNQNTASLFEFTDIVPSEVELKPKAAAAV